MYRSRTNPPVSREASLRDVMKSCVLPLLIFYAVYAFYLMMSPLIHAQPAPPLDPEKATLWARWAVLEHDGHEVEVMFVVLCLSLWAIYFSANRIGRIAWLNRPQLLAVLPLPAVATFVYLHSPIVRPPVTISEFLLVLTGGLCLTAMHFLVVNRHLPRIPKYAILGVFWAGMLSMLLLTQPPSVVDYSYYLAPALKFLQGEHFRNFYSQYGSGGVLLFAAMAKHGMLIHQMQLVVALMFILWLLMYQRVTWKLFNDRFLACLFISVFFITKYCGDGGGGCLMCPQVSPFRLDLWVPVLLVVARFGLFSPACSLTIAVIYLSDNLMGALFFGAYGFYCLIITVRNALRKEMALAKVLSVALPAFIALCIQYFTLGTFFSSSAMWFHNIKLGFLPIDNHSLFWPILVVVFISLYILTKFRVPRDILLTLYGSFAVESVYFLGRSHDFNLLNISGIFLLILFFALDRISAAGDQGIRPKIRIAAGIILIIMPFYFTNEIRVKLGYAHERIRGHTALQPDSIEISVSQLKKELKSVKSGKITTIGLTEAYFNYRLGMPEVGALVPFGAHLEKNETCRFLGTLLDSGYTPVVPNDEIFWIDDLNSADLMIAERKRIVFHAIDHFSTVNIESY